jgi:hypothetical protein
MTIDYQAMLPPELGEVADPVTPPPSGEELSVSVRALRLLEKYLYEILHNCSNSSQETLYVWDWEMVHEAIDPHSPSAVFSGILWSGLELLDRQPEDRGTKIVYAEGTKRELLWYLSKLSGDYLRRTGSSDQPDATADGLEPPEFSNRPDWKETLQNVWKLIRIDESVDRLLFLLTNYAQPMPVDPALVPKHIIDSYQSRLKRLRDDDDSESRNEADAWNLACVDVLSRQSKNTRPVELVTATRVVKSVSQGTSRDPFYFALDLQLRRDYPRKTDRYIALHQMLQHLHALSAKMIEIHAMQDCSDERAYLRRGDATRLLNSLVSSLEHDPILSEVWGLVVRSAEALHNSRVQSRESAKALDLSSGEFVALSRFEHKVKKALTILGTEQPSHRDLSLTWTPVWTNGDISRLTLVSPNIELIDAEISGDCLAISWISGVTITGFLLALDAMWDRIVGSSPIRTKILTFQTSQTSSVDKVNDRPIDLVNVIGSIGVGRIAMMRVFAAELSFWYDCTPQLSKRDLSVRVREPRIALSFLKSTTALNCLAQFYNKTSKKWLFETAVESALSSLVGGS